MWRPVSKRIYVIDQKGSLAQEILRATYILAFAVITAAQVVDSITRGVVSLIALAIISGLFVRSLKGHNAGRQRLGLRHYESDELAAGSQIWGSVVAQDIGNYSRTAVLHQESTWSLYDLLYRSRTDTAQGSLRCYTVFEAKLVRTTPHLMFDARLAQGRQFRSIFLQAQSISLEGNFNQYFDVYAPDHYVIDSMSFVSPEVMQAFMTLKNYDAELIHGKLLVYAPLLSEDELVAFRVDCVELAKQLNDNLGRYRDTYLPSRNARKNTAPFARLLLENPWQKTWQELAVGVAATLFVLYLGLTWKVEALYNPYSLIAYVVLLIALTRVALAFRKNLQRKKSFYSDLRVIQERGRY